VKWLKISLQKWDTLDLTGKALRIETEGLRTGSRFNHHSIKHNHSHSSCNDGQQGIVDNYVLVGELALKPFQFLFQRCRCRAR
jgi:hypothetical protein